MPVELLAHFQQVVVEPEYLPDPDRLTRQGVSVYAYVSVGEANPTRSWYRDIEKSWLLGGNRAWGTDILDLTSSGWRNYLLSKVLTPLWKQGYRAFFLDTLDSYQNVLKNRDALMAQEQALVHLIQTIHKRFPGVKIILNRGFEILPRVRNLINGVAAESLFQGWDPKTRRYRAVREPDRTWLLQRLNEAREKYQLQVIVIDYVPPIQRKLARDTAKRIATLGFTPWVANPSLDILGVGNIEVYPRQILALYDSQDYKDGLQSTPLHRLLAMPAEYLGYTFTYLDIRQGLPDFNLSGQYAGIVTWFSSDDIDRPQWYEEWLLKHLDEGLKLLLLGKPGFIARDAFRQRIGMEYVGKTLAEPVTIEHGDSLTGFETKPTVRLAGLTAWRAVQGDITRHLSLVDQAGQIVDPVVSGPWGGAALDPYLVETGLTGVEKWVINPFELLTRALHLPPIPVPDVTTENGRRLLITQIEGADGPGRLESPVAIRAIYEQIVNVYNLPGTVSLNIGQPRYGGNFSGQSRQIEKYARKMFCRREIEIASTPNSHAGTRNTKRKAGTAGEDARHVAPGTETVAINDLKESLDYLHKYLAPAGKSARVISLKDNRSISPAARAWASSSGIEITVLAGAAVRHSAPTLTEIPPTGIPAKDSFQVYVPDAIDLSSLERRSGSGSGLKNVIETFQYTDLPRRLKPVHIHYRFDSGSGSTALRLLKEVYRWVLGRALRPVWLSEYARKVHDFQTVTLARHLEGGWEIRGLHALRTLRIPVRSGWPDLARSVGVTGVRQLPQGRYLSLLPSNGLVRLFLSEDTPVRPYLLHTNGKVEKWAANRHGILFRISAANRLEVVIATGNPHCHVRWKGGKIDGQSDSGAMRFLFPATASGDAQLVCAY